MPSEFYQPIIAKTFGTVTHAMFPVPPRPDANAEIVAASGMDTLELVARLQRSDLDDATLNAVRVMADTLCSEYASRPADDLLTEGRAWLRRVTQYQGQRLTLKQHREILVQAGWMALLIGCVEYDVGDKQTEGKTPKEALRCLKRRLSDLVYYQLIADRQGTIGACGSPTTPPPTRSTSTSPATRSHRAAPPSRPLRRPAPAGSSRWTGKTTASSASRSSTPAPASTTTSSTRPKSTAKTAAS